MKWTEEEIAWLQENYPTHGKEYCASYLNRTSNSIRRKVEQLSFKRVFAHQLLTKKFLTEQYVNQNKSASVIAKENNIKTNDVYTALKKFDIPRSTKGYNLKQNHHAWKGCGDLSKTQWLCIQNSAKERSIEFVINIEYAWSLFNGVCSLSGRPIHFAKVAYRWYEGTASLDRIDSSQGYIIGNIQWIHKKLQKVKSNMNEDEFISWCDDISQYRGIKSC